jgi:UDP-N-acetyl-D-mannosaminuronic acid dehydrogenase
MLVNEGLPLFIIQQLERRMDLKNKTVGILGMAFKGESDDNRASLSYKLKKALELKTKKVLCTDEFIKSPHFVSLDDCLNQSDIVILGAPHKAYKNINTKKELVDVWNFIER